MKIKIYIALEAIIQILLIINILRYLRSNTDAGIAFIIALGINTWRLWEKFEPYLKKSTQ